MEHYKQPQWLSDFLYLAEFVFLGESRVCYLKYSKSLLPQPLLPQSFVYFPLAQPKAKLSLS